MKVWPVTIISYFIFYSVRDSRKLELPVTEQLTDSREIVTL